MKHNNLLVVSAVMLSMLPLLVQALEVDREVMPRIELGGRLMSTVDAVNLDSDPDHESALNLADSSLLLRFDKRLYEKGVAGATIGMTENEGELVLHQLHGFYWNRDWSVMAGRTRLRNTLLEFPLMRDDDLLAYSHVGNASSNEEFDQVYGDQLSVDWLVDRKIQRLGLWVGSRHNGDAFTGAPGGFDSAGLSYVYEQPEDYRYIKKLRHAGLMLDSQKVDTTSGSEWLHALIGGAEVNLNINPLSSWSLAGQMIINRGVDGVLAADVLHGAANSVSARAAGESTSVVVSLRHTGRPKLLTRYQAGLTLAYKDFSDINEGNQWSLVSNAFYRLGAGIDLMAQLKHTEFGDGLGGGSDTVAQIGMTFSFDALFNDNIGERDSIINLEHGYIQ